MMTEFSSYPPYSSHKNGPFVDFMGLASGLFCFQIFLLFSCTEPLVLLLDIANWCVLPYYFSVVS